MAANSILKLRVDSQEYDTKLKKAAEGLQHLAKSAHDCGGELLHLEKDEVAFIREMGSMNTSAKTAAGSIREMESTLKAMTLTYKQMSDAEKSGNVGKALSDAMSELRSRLIPAKQALAETEKEIRKLNQEVSASQNPFGQYGSIIDTLGSKLGVSGNLTELLTSQTAMLTAGMGAAVAVIGKATEAWASYNAELAKQDQITTVTTGLKGDDADRMTDQMRALSDTYKVDFREAVNAANTLMTQFGKTGDEAVQLIKDGMQGMIQGDGPKLLRMIQQYAPSFRDAGIAADQLVAIIHNSEGGIFTDQNMNAIVMGIKNIRLMTKATSDALAQLGIDGQKMSKQLSDGTITIFDALKQVATAIDGTNSSSQAAGEVMQQVFGRQGAMAGTKLGEAIATLNTNLEETKRQTGQVGESFAQLQQANERLNTAIRECFEYDGWDEMANGIKAKLVGALADVLELTVKIKDSWVGDIGSTIFDTMTDAALKSLGPLGTVLAYLKDILSTSSGNGAQAVEGAIGGVMGAVNNAVGTATGSLGTILDEVVVRPKAKTKTKPTKTTGSGKQNIQFANDSIMAQEKLVADLTQKWKTASGSMRDGYLKDLEEAKKKLDEMLGTVKKIDDSAYTLTESQLAGVKTNNTPDMRGNNGRAQDKLDLATAAFATSGTSQADISAYISSIKSAIQDANIGSDLYNSLTEKLKDATTMSTLLQELMERGLKGADLERMSKSLQEKLLSPEGIDQKAIKQWLETVSDQIEEHGGIGMSLNSETGEVTDKKSGADEWKQFESKANQFIGGLSSVSSGLKGLGVELPKEVDQVIGVMQSVMQIIQGVESIISVFQVSAITANTAALIANTAALAVNTAVPSVFAHGGVVPAFAHGGLIGRAALGMIIPGNSYSGDNLRLPVDGGRGVIGVNSGELILNKSSQNNLASSLLRAEDLVSTINDGGITLSSDQQAMLSSVAYGGAAGTPSSQQYVTGDAIVLGANNYLNSTGQGEIVTTEYLRNKGLI